MVKCNAKSQRRQQFKSGGSTYLGNSTTIMMNLSLAKEIYIGI
jgi:hypothetical protein